MRDEDLSHDSGTVEVRMRDVAIEGPRGTGGEEEALTEGEQDAPQEAEDEFEVADEPQAVMGNRPRVLKTPKSPTKQQREEHEATHATYQSWCKACVRA